jgi:hypothetical protein
MQSEEKLMERIVRKAALRGAVKRGAETAFLSENDAK